MALRQRTLRAAAIGATMLAATGAGCGQRGYESPRTALSVQRGFPARDPASGTRLLPAGSEHAPGPSPATEAPSTQAQATQAPSPKSPKSPWPPPLAYTPHPPVPEIPAPPSAQRPGKSARAPSYRQPLGPLRAEDPAMRFANLSPQACRAEIAARKLPVVWATKGRRGIQSPLRLTGPLRGVRFVTHPAPSPYGIMDCRMALALDELAAVLVRFGVVEVRIDNVYRKGARIRSGKRSQHSHALAADITVFTKTGGQRVEVEHNWGAPIGRVPCGPEAVMVSPTTHTVWLRSLVCEIARQGVFHHLLTPSFNAAHRNHFHFDIQRDRSRLYLR